jgi:hypothetical protein
MRSFSRCSIAAPLQFSLRRRIAIIMPTAAARSIAQAPHPRGPPHRRTQAR